MKEKNNTAKDEINRILGEIQENWDNLKKARHITIELGKKFKYNPIYNYGDEDTKNEIFNQSFMSKYNFQASAEESKDRNVDYLNFNDQNKVCVELQTIYDYLLTLANVKHESMGSDIYIFFSNDENECKGCMQSIVKDLYTVKTKKCPKGFVTNGEDEKREMSQRLEKIDKELGYIDERGYIGENLTEMSKGIETTETVVDLEKLLNNIGTYVSKVLKANISDVELHQYYKYLLKDLLPDKHIFIIPFSGKDDYENIQYLINSRISDNQNEFFLYNEEEGCFQRVSPESLDKIMEEKKVLTGKGEGGTEKGESRTQRLLADIAKNKKKTESDNPEL